MDWLEKFLAWSGLGFCGFVFALAVMGIIRLCIGC